MTSISRCSTVAIDSKRWSAGIDIDPDIHFNEMDLDDAGAVLHVMSMNVHRRT
jgi:hypothetical protein